MENIVKTLQGGEKVLVVDNIDFKSDWPFDDIDGYLFSGYSEKDEPECTYLMIDGKYHIPCVEYHERENGDYEDAYISEVEEVDLDETKETFEKLEKVFECHEDKDKVWILTKSFNDYNQHGEYYEAAFKVKPTVEVLKGLYSYLSEEEITTLLSVGEVRLQDDNQLHLEELGLY